METKERLEEKFQLIGLTWLGGAALIVLGLVLVIGQIFDADEVFWSIALIASGTVFTVTFFIDRDHWWGLIPAYAMIVTGVFVALAGDTYSTWAGYYWAFVTGIPFIAVFATSPKQRWWALIPAYAMLVIGVGLLLIDILEDFWIPAFLLFALAPPFFAVYGTGTHRTWALVTGGILTALSIGYALAAVEVFIPIILVAGGIFMLARQISRKRGLPAWAPRVRMPARGPEADRAPADFEPLESKG